MASQLTKAEEAMKKNPDVLFIQNLNKLRERHYFAIDEVSMAGAGLEYGWIGQNLSRGLSDLSSTASSTQTNTSTPPNHNEPIRRGLNHTASSKASTLTCIICCCYVQTTSKVTREWRDHEKERNVTPALQSFASSKPK
jgi:hypothetical protein